MLLFRVCSVVLLVLCYEDVSHCLEDNEDGAVADHRRVVGGLLATQREWRDKFSYVANLEGKIQTKVWYPGLMKYLQHVETVTCGAVVINEYWLLTTAHCFILDDVSFEASVKPELYKIRYGDRSIKDAAVAQVTTIVIHPDYDEFDDWANDIALIKVNRSMTSGTKLVKPIPIPSPNLDDWPPVNKYCVLVGWGCRGDRENKELQQQKSARSVRLPIVGTKYCSELYALDTSGSRLCAGNRSKFRAGACSGDSGSPLVCRKERGGQYYLAGLTAMISFGNIGTEPTLFTKVPFFNDWIRETTAIEPKL